MCDPGNITGNSNRRSIPRKTVWTSHWVECIICGMHLAAKSLCSHIETQHNTYRSFILNQELTVVCEAPPVPISVRYRHVWALQALNKLFSNFFNAIPRTWCAAQWKGPFFCCSATDVDCRSCLRPQMADVTRQPFRCKDEVVRKAQHAAAERAHLALQQTFTVYGKSLKW